MLRRVGRGPYLPGMRYPRPALAFLVLLGIAGAASIVDVGLRTSLAELAVLPTLVWCCLAAVCESSSVHLPRGNIQVSSTEAVFAACYLTAGPASTILAIFCACFLYVSRGPSGAKHAANTHLRLTLFNLFHYVLILRALDSIYRLLAGSRGELLFVPAMLVAPLFFLLSCLLNTAFYTLEEGRPPVGYFLDTFAPHLPSAMALSLAGVVVAVAFRRLGILAVLLFALPLGLTRLSFLSQEREWE